MFSKVRFYTSNYGEKFLGPNIATHEVRLFWYDNPAKNDKNYIDPRYDYSDILCRPIYRH